MYTRMYIPVMSHSYSIAEARSNLPTIVDQAEAGVEIELTRRGKPVAVVVAIAELDRLRNDRPGFAATYRRFLDAHAVRDVGLDDDFASSARARGPGRRVAV